MSNYPKKVYLNGEIIDHKDAKISVFDRGFLFGDGVYEVMLQMNQNFFFGKEHLERLSNCLQKVYINFDVSTLPNKIHRILEASDLKKKDCLIYIQITRGVAPRKHAFPNNTQPTVMLYAFPFELPDINNPVKVVTMPDHRWHRCDIKMISLLGNIMANDHAVTQGAYEAALIRNGKVTEASHCNIFFVKDGILYTHPADEHILDGVTRQIVMRLCKDLDIEVREEAIHENDIVKMDEAFLTGTTSQIASIRQIDDHSFYQNNEVGPVTKKLQEAFLELKNK